MKNTFLDQLVDEIENHFPANYVIDTAEFALLLNKEIYKDDKEERKVGADYICKMRDNYLNSINYKVVNLTKGDKDE